MMVSQLSAMLDMYQISIQREVAHPWVLWGAAARGIALVQFVALVSCWLQLQAFGGSRGLNPVKVKLAKMKLHRGHWSSNFRLFLSAPTLLWFGSSDVALHVWAALGAGGALIGALGGAAYPWCVLVANFVYLSFDVVFGLSMPWDCLLLEVGWLATLLPAPPALWATAAVPRAPHAAAAWLVRWLLFRLLFGFGKLKFVGTRLNDRLYVRDFMILQPMPNVLGWCAVCAVCATWVGLGDGECVGGGRGCSSIR